MFTKKKDRKVQFGETIEKLDAMGQESEIKAAKWVKEVGKEEEKEEKEVELEKIESLERKARFSFSSYKQYLCQIIQDTLTNRINLRSEWKYRSFFSDKGVGLLLFSPDGRKFSRGFAPVNVPVYDLHACVSLCLNAENTIDKIEDEKTHVNGIYRPGHEKIITKLNP